MSKWIYPSEEILRWWGEFLKNPTIFLNPYLPHIDDEWINAVSKTLDLLKFGPYDDDFYHKASHVLYKICKNHNFVDGNKRSSIIVLYLFCIINKYSIICSPETVKLLAESVAKIKGSQNHESDIKDIEKKLKEIVVPFD